MASETIRFPRRPFRSAPSPEAFVPVASHAACLTTLATAVTADDGLLLLDGDAGTGKTTITLKLMQSLTESFTPVLLPTGRFQTAGELHQAILFDCSKPYQGLSEQELRLAVTEQLLLLALQNQRALIVIDEAHALGDAALAELFYFDNLTDRQRRAVAVLLVARPSLRDRLRGTSLQQRLARTLRLESLTGEEAIEYLQKQECEPAFTDEAIELLVVHGEGNPRRLNRLAATALTLTVGAGEEMIDAEAALAAVEFHRPASSAQPAHHSHAVESMMVPAAKSANDDHPATGRTPKQKARKRKAA